MDGHVSFNRHKGCGFEAILQRKFPGKSLMEYLKPGQKHYPVCTGYGYCFIPYWKFTYDSSQDDLRNLEKARRVSDDQLSKQLRGMKKSLNNLKKELEFHKNPERFVMMGINTY